MPATAALRSATTRINRARPGRTSSLRKGLPHRLPKPRRPPEARDFRSPTARATGSAPSHRSGRGRHDLRDRVEEIVLTVLLDRLLVLLRLDPAVRKIAVEDRRHQFVAEDRLVGRGSDDPFLARGMRRLPDRQRGDLGLVDRPHGLRPPPRMRPDPVELRRVHARQLDHRQPHLAVIGQQLDPNGIDEALNRMLGCAIGRLQRDPAIGERRSDEHDRARSLRNHVLQCSPRSVHLAHEGHVHHPAELLQAHVEKAREDAGEGIVHPDVDPSELLYRSVGGAAHRFGVGNVGRNDERLPAKLLDLACGGFEPFLAAGKKRHRAASASKLASGRAADPGRRARDHSNIGHPAVRCLLRRGGSPQPPDFHSSMARP